MFPFALEDLQSWTVKRKDGTVTKFTLADVARKKETTKGGRFPSTTIAMDHYTGGTTAKTQEKLGEWCKHTPKDPLFEIDKGDRENGSALALYVGDMYGARATRENFDFVIDGGDVLTLYGSSGSGSSKILAGDQELSTLLKPFTVDIPTARVLKISWFDRHAPDVVPGFWTELNKALYGDVMTCCQGGHGRSGTAFVCLLLNNAPDYSALDAIIHLRALHCPRAIESQVQHDYIDSVAAFLGREANAAGVKGVKDYKEAFRASKKPTAVRVKKALKWV